MRPMRPCRRAAAAARAAAADLRRPHRWRPVTDKRVGQSLHKVHAARNRGVRAPLICGWAMAGPKLDLYRVDKRYR
eukprot:6844476-Prymnesium_polylepis.1